MLIVIILAVICVLFVLAALVPGGTAGTLVAIVLAVVLWLFSSLTVEVSETELRVRFGRGLIGKRIPLTHISAVRQVRNKWYYGWGVRYFPGGVLYNIQGFSAVEVELKSGKLYRIGTDEPEKLEQALKWAAGSAKLKAIKSPDSFPPDQRWP
jgi:hypothetical protein